MSIEAPQGILNIPNATLRVGKLAVDEVVGADTILNTVARNTILLVDGETYHENKNWGLKLPNAWAGEFECNTASAGNYSEFNFYNEGASSNAQGYNLTFNDTAAELRYDGTLLTSGTLPSTVTGTGVKKVRLMFERTILSVTVDGTLIFTHDDTGGPRPRVYSTTAGGFLNFFTDGGALKNLKIVNEKWISDGTSNIAYVGGGEVSITGSLDVASNVTAANSKFSLDTNGTFKRFADENGHTIKMTKYIAYASNMRIAQGSYSGSAFQWVSVRVKFTRLDVHTQTIQFDYLGSYGSSSVKNAIVTGDSPGANQDSEVVVYNKTGDSTYEIYLQIDSATTIDVEIYHKGSTIDEHYATLTTANSGAIDETGLTMVYNSGTYADFSLRDKNDNGNVGIGTTNPLCPLDVHTTVTGDIDVDDTNDGHILSWNGVYRFDNYATHNVAMTADNQSAAIVAHSFLAGFSINFLSDRRIKKDIKEIDDESALEKFRLLKPSKYKYIEPLLSGRTDKEVYGYIAQEVAEVLPEGVTICDSNENTNQGHIPNIMSMCRIESQSISSDAYDILDAEQKSEYIETGNTYTRQVVTITETIDLDTLSVIDSTPRYKMSKQTKTTGAFDKRSDGEYHPLIFYSKNLQTIRANVVRVIDDSSFVVDKNLLDVHKFKNDELLLYGQKPNDFHRLNKDVIFTLATAALQEVDRQLQAEKVKVITLETQLTSVLTRLDALEGA
jgi:hypothetical protein